jgi:hypothetical protein
VLAGRIGGGEGGGSGEGEERGCGSPDWLV